MRIRALVAGAAVALALLPAAPAHAAGNGEWAVTPTPAAKAGPTPRLYFFLDATAGQAVKESVRVQNLTKTPKSFFIFGADAYNTVRDGGFALRTREQKQTGLGSWVTTTATRVTVPAGSQADIPFTINVPRNASPGDHVGGIVALETSPGATALAGGANVRIQRAVAARVYLRVAGTVVPGLAVPSLSMDIGTPWLPRTTGGDLTYHVSNIGNIHLVPKATVSASGLFGHDISLKGSTPAGDFVPGAQGEFAMRAGGIWPIDIVSTSVTLKADGGVYARRTDRAFVVSYTGIALLIAFGVAAGWAVRRRRRSRVPRPRGLVTE
ncbi:WxL protein peptidoglycan domain-containing protein [Actinoplanes sp. CA-054009]